MAKNKRLKSAAQRAVPQTRDEVAFQIKVIGDKQRLLTRLKTEMNDHIGNITDSYSGRISDLEAELKALQGGVQAYCEAHRAELTEGGKSKTVNLTTGNVSWRTRPRSVRIKGAKTVIDVLKRLGLSRFVRVKSEVNKEAILNEPAAVMGVSGISISSGVEDFVVTPFEQEV